MKMKSLFSVLLAMVMLIGMMTVTAFAVEDTEPVADEAAKTVTVSNAEQLLAISEYSNSSSDTKAYPRNFSGWTVVIANDLDMTGKTWKPLVDFHGNMHGSVKEDGTTTTISHLTVSVSANAGLCANSATGKFSNLTIADSSFTNTNKTSGAYAGAFAANGFTSSFENCSVVNTSVTGVRFVGGITGTAYGNITNCTVTDCEIKSNASRLAQTFGRGDNFGGIVGLMGEGRMVISGCKVEGTTVSGSRQISGIAGAAQYGNTVTECKVIDCSITATGPSTINNGTTCAGGFVGQFASQAVDQPITVTENTICGTSTITGEIAGWAVGDANSRVVDGSTYSVSGNICEITTSLNEIGK